MVFKEYKGLDLPAISSEILNFWEEAVSYTHLTLPTN